jgi:UDP-GlcNAc:undecaprenyl-phosphate/decaprenyl-phosphate GlcNAc-1-phosphate transferase
MKQVSLELALPVAVSFLSSILLTPLMRKLALYFNIVAKPNPLVQSHTSPTPYLGGVAVYLSVILGLGFSGFFGSHLSLLFCIGLMTVLGVCDDLMSFAPLTKLLGQIFISILGIFFIIQINAEQLSALQLFLYIFWLLITTNALNLIDVMDGLAAGVSAIAFGGLFLIAGIRGFDELSVIFLTISMALVGFLPFNFHRARVFLGDAGSLMIGFYFGLFTLANLNFRVRLDTPPVIFLLFSIPLFELAFVFIMRSYSGKPFWKGSRDHFSLRLLSVGWKVPQIVLLTYAIGATMLFTTLIFEFFSPLFIRWFAIIPAIVLVLCAWKYLSGIKVDG